MTTEELKQDRNFRVLSGNISQSAVEFEVLGMVVPIVGEAFNDSNLTIIVANKRTKAVVVKESIQLSAFERKEDVEGRVQALCRKILFRVIGIGLTYLEEKMLVVGLIPKEDLETMVGE